MGNETHPINVSRIDANGTIVFEKYTNTDLGQCMSKPSESMSPSMVLGLMIVGFAIILIAIALVLIFCNQKVPTSPKKPKKDRKSKNEQHLGAKSHGSESNEKVKRRSRKSSLERTD